MQSNPLSVLERTAAKGPFTAIELPWVTALLASDPRVAEEVLVTHARAFGKTTRGYRVMRRLLGNGLLTSDGEFWLKQRRTAQPAFHRERIAALGDRMTRLTEQTLARWTSDAAFDMHAEMMRLTLAIVADTLLSSDVSGQSAAVGTALTELLEQSLWRTTHAIHWPSFFPTPKNRRFAESKRTLDAIVKGIIAERRLGESGDDLLGMLMDARDPETGEGMSDAQLRDEVMTIFLAGHETTANALSWVFSSLAREADISARASEEIRSTLGTALPTARDVQRLPYTNAVLKETLRLFPPAWIVGRGALHDLEIAGRQVKKGSFVFVSPWVMHRSPALWREPERFDPERWLDASFKPHKCAYMPFLTGPRKCIGDGFATMEAVLVIAMVLQRFTLSAEAALPEPDPVITLRPKGGATMRVTRHDRDAKAA